MKSLVRLAATAGAAVGLSAVALPAVAGADPSPEFPPFAVGADHAVFVQTDNPAGNQIVAYQRNDNGTLAPAGTYATGVLGGVLEGSAVDHLAPQGSLAYDPLQGLLYAVNAGSNTVSVFSVRGDQLVLRQVVSSGGNFPVSIAVHGNSVYVLNGLSANRQGHVSFFGRLIPLPGSNRSLGFTVPSGSTQFVSTPGQVSVRTGWIPAARHHQAERERGRRVPRRTLRLPLRLARCQCGAGRRPLRGQLRRRTAPRGGRCGHERPVDVHPGAERHADSDRHRRDR